MMRATAPLQGSAAPRGRGGRPRPPPPRPRPIGRWRGRERLAAGFDQCLAGRRERDPPAEAFEQRHADLFLELLDRLRERRLRHVRGAGGGGERPLVDHGEEHREPASIHKSPLMVLTRRTGWTSHTGRRTLREMHLVAITAAGLGVGVFFGMFGAGGSAFATPVLALLGVPAPLAVASPPAGDAAGVDGGRVASRGAGGSTPSSPRSTSSAAFPARVGALASARRRPLPPRALGRDARRCRRAPPRAGRRRRRDRAADRRGRTYSSSPPLRVGLLTGLLANGGGFLLVPLFVVGYGLSAGEAAGTSMLAVGALVIPTLVSHWALGHIDWSVSFAFATGTHPRVAGRIPSYRTHPGRRRAARVRRDAALVRRVVPLDAGLRGRLHAPASVPAISPIAVRSQGSDNR